MWFRNVTAFLFLFVVFSYLCSHLRALDKDSRPNVILVSYSWSYLFHSVFIFMQKTSFTGLSTQTIFTIDVQEKWKAYLQRIRSHVSPPDVMLAAHHPGDEMCPWVHAEIILSAFNTRRQELGSTVVEVEWLTGMQKSKKNKSLHNYHDNVIYRPRYLQRLLPTCIGMPDSGRTGAASHLSFEQCFLPLQEHQ